MKNLIPNSIFLIFLFIFPCLCFSDSESTVSGRTGADHIIQDEGTSLRPRPYLNFTGSGVTCTDTGGKTVCNMTGGGSGGGSAIAVKVNGSTISSSIDTLTFTSDFTGTESPSGTVNITSNTWTRTSPYLYPKNITDNVGIGTTIPQGGLVVMNGNVGIGTWGPTNSLQITGGGLTSSGNVGVGGNTTVNNTGLTVNANTNSPAVLSSCSGAGCGFTLTASGSASGILNLKSTTNTGTTDAIKFLLGTNGGTTGMIVQDSSGTVNVGIGTTTPQARLVAMGNVGIGTWIADGGNLIVNGGGNVGIGSAWPGTALDVVGTVRSTNVIDTGLTATTPVVANSGKQLASGSYKGNTTMFQMNNGSLTSGNLIKSDANQNTVDAGVSFGTLTDTKFCTYTSGSTSIACTSDGGVGSSQWTTINTNDVYLPNSGNVGLGTTLTHTSALTVMNGNVGIGTWKPTNLFTVGSTSQATVDSSGNFSTSGTYQSSNNGTTSTPTHGWTNNGWYLAAANSPALSANNARAIGVNSDGNVGIGPDIDNTSLFNVMFNQNNLTMFQIKNTDGGASNQTLIREGNGTDTANLLLNGTGGALPGEGQLLTTNNMDIMTQNSGKVIKFGINSAETERIDANGNLGVGSASPGTKLDVNGFIRSTSLTASKCVQTDSTGILTSAAAACGSGGGSGQWITAANVGIGTTDNVGIGTLVPSAKLVITQQSVTQPPVSSSTAQFVGTDANPLRITFDTHNNTNSSGTAMMFRRSRGTSASPSAALSGDVIGALSGRVYGATGYAAASTGLINIKLNQDATDTNMGTYISFDTTPDNSVTATEKVRITGAGNVGIGTTIPGGALVVMSGNVGLGTWKPTQLLDVKGTANATTLTQGGTSVVLTTRSIATTAPVAGGGDLSADRTITCNVASGSQPGCLASADWTTFNGKISSQWTTINTNDVYLPNRGNVGLGTTFTTTSALTVMNGNVGIGTWIPQSLFNVMNGNVGIGTLNALNSLIVWGGNVGIGTNLPGSALDVGPGNSMRGRPLKRFLSLSAGSGTPAINTDLYDVVHITAQSAAITSFTSSLTGTPVQGDTLRIDVTDDGTARALTFGASFEASTVALPTTTVISTRLDMLFLWNTATTKWRIAAVA